MEESQTAVAAETLSTVAVPGEFNYVGVFLTLDCNRSCSYCINHYSPLANQPELLSGEEWLAGLGRLKFPRDLPITLQGGEPSLHPDFFLLARELSRKFPVHILTNLDFDLARFIEEVPVEGFRKQFPYAAIRVSFHPEWANAEELLRKTLRLQNAGYSIGVFGVLHPEHSDEIEQARSRFVSEGIDFRTKEYLGEWNGRLHGTYKWPEGLDGIPKEAQCRSRDLLVSPSGNFYLCHQNLYSNQNHIGNILDPTAVIPYDYRDCSVFGLCNPCDLKIKHDRFQNGEHTSVCIIPKSEP